MPKIRPYRAADWDSFIALDVETGALSLDHAADGVRFGEAWPERLRERFGWTEVGPTRPEGNTLLVLEDDDDTYAGHLWLSLQVDLFSGEPKLFVTTVAVVAKFRGRGFGRLLMDRAIDEAHARGLERVALGVDVRNEGARKLYERMGFRTTRLSMERNVRST